MTAQISIERELLEDLVKVLEFMWRDVAMNEYAFKKLEAAITTGRAALTPSEALELDPAGIPKLELTVLERKAIDVLNSIKACDDVVQLPASIRMAIETILLMASVRRVGVR